jgi:hypothetical protein
MPGELALGEPQDVRTPRLSLRGSGIKRATYSKMAVYSGRHEVVNCDWRFAYSPTEGAVSKLKLPPYREQPSAARIIPTEGRTFLASPSISLEVSGE